MNTNRSISSTTHRLRSQNKQRRSPSAIKSRPNSIIHVRIRPSRSVSSLSKKNSTRSINDSAQNSVANWSMASARPVTVTRVPRSLISSNFIHTNLKSAKRNNEEMDISNLSQRAPPASNTATNTKRFESSSTVWISKRKSWGNIEDLTNPSHQHNHSTRNKKKINLLTKLCQCTKLRLLTIICVVILLIILLAVLLIVLLSKSNTKTLRITREAILRWNTTGITLFGTTSVKGNASDQLANPFGVLFDSNEWLYISDRNNHRIKKCHIHQLICVVIAGEANAVAGTNMSDLRGPTFMYLDSNDNLYIADSANQRVQFWDYGVSYGSQIAGVTGISGSALNQLNLPYGITMDSSSGTVYIADCNNNRVISYASGASSGTIAAGGNGVGTNNTQLSCPAGLFLDQSSNSLIIVNFDASNIVRWSLGDTKWSLLIGNSNGSAGTASTLLDHPTSMIFDPMGNAYVADMFNNRIQFFSSDLSNGTTIVGISGQSGNNATMLYYPTSVALDNQLNLYVADSFNQRIQQFLRY